MHPDSITRAVLPNRLTVLVHHEPQSRVAAIVTYVRAGYFDETDDIVGIAHVVEHMFFKGTPRFGVGEIARATKAAGGYLNAHTIYDHTSYYTVLPATAFRRGLEIQADAYASSLIDRDELARELEVIIQEVKRKTDNPGAVSVETLYEVLHDRHRIRRWRIGREDALRALTRDQVYGFYRRFYQPSNTVLVIAGGVATDEALAEVERLYGGQQDEPVQRSQGPRENGVAEFRYRELAGDVQRTQLLFGWRGVSIRDEDAPKLDLAAAALSWGRASRLYRAVRERELASAVRSHNYTLPEMGVFTVHAETDAAKTIEAARAAWMETQQLGVQPLAEHELARVRQLYEARWLRDLETMEGRANFLASWEALGSWELGPEYLDAVRGVTAESLRDAARRHLRPDGASVLAYRPETAPGIATDADALRRELEVHPFAVPVQAAPRARPAPARRRPSLERETAGVRVYRTERGLPLLVMRKRGLQFVYSGVYTASGAAADAPERAGLTLLLSRVAVKGSESRTAAEIAEEAERLGGSIGTSASGDSLGWSFAVPRAATAQALELLAEVAQRPSFPAEALEVERTVALASLASLRDDMFSFPLRLMNGAAFGAHPYAIPAAGTEDGLRSASRTDLATSHQERVEKGAAVVGIIGDDDPDDLAAIAAGAFSHLGAGEMESLTAPVWCAGAVREESREKAQTALAIAFPAPARRDPERHAMELVAKIASGLGGRFFDELRDRRSLAYTVHAFASARPLAGMFATYIATSPEREDEAREGMMSEVRRLLDDPPGPDELDRAREYAIGTEVIRRESGSALLAEIVDAWLFGDLGEIVSYEADMRAITADDVQRVVEQYLDPDRAAYGVVRGNQR
jgi:zinc protease